MKIKEERLAKEMCYLLQIRGTKSERRKGKESQATGRVSQWVRAAHGKHVKSGGAYPCLVIFNVVPDPDTAICPFASHSA